MASKTPGSFVDPLATHDVRALASRYGTPLYVLNLDLALERAREYRRAFRAVDRRSRIFYAAKAWSLVPLLRALAREGLGFDLCSEGELHAAGAAGIRGSSIIAHGNNKSDRELKAFVDARAFAIILDAAHELDRLEEIAGILGRKVPVMIRVNPGLDVHTHAKIATGHYDTKFGFAVEGGAAAAAVARVARSRRLVLRGLHCQVGSMIDDTKTFELTARTLAKLSRDLVPKPPADFVLNLGGGLAVPYLPGRVVPTVAEYATALKKGVDAVYKGRSPAIAVEPGRSIVAAAAATIYTVGVVKTQPGEHTFVSVDGSMADHPRTALYGAQYHADLYPREVAGEEAGGRAATDLCVVGKACETGDVIVTSIRMPLPEPGDLLAIRVTGAYHDSMASTYNRLPRPAVVFVSKDGVALAARRETFEDLVAREIRNPRFGASAARKAAGRVR